MQYIIFIVFYIIGAYFVYRIARKLNDKLAFLAWIPFLADYLITRLARKPFYWVLLMYIPILNIWYDYVLWREISKRFNKNFIFGILMLIPFVNWIVLYLFAYVFKESEKKSEPVQDKIEEKKEDEKPEEETKEEEPEKKDEEDPQSEKPEKEKQE